MISKRNKKKDSSVCITFPAACEKAGLGWTIEVHGNHFTIIFKKEDYDIKKKDTQ
jgi:hypothetical protein